MSEEKHNKTKEQEAAEKQAKKDADEAADKCIEPEQTLPPIDFSRFVISLAHEALMFLGEQPNPETGKKQTNLALAKQTIDILGMLEEKTKGNLTVAEERLLSNILYELRTKFVLTCRKK